jgi:hypothetical protein
MLATLIWASPTSSGISKVKVTASRAGLGKAANVADAERESYKKSYFTKGELSFYNFK